MPSHSAIARQWKFPSPVIAAAINRSGSWLAATLADGTAQLLPAHADTETPRALDLHNDKSGVSLSLQPDADPQGFISGGDDGRVFLIDPVVATPTLLAEQKGRWIDNVATSESGYRAYSFGKQCIILNAEGEQVGNTKTLPSSIGGMAFSPNGKRLATSHYNGLTLWWVNAKDNEPTVLEWKGSHLGVVWSPDGKIVMTAMQESALHGWRLADLQEMRMQGYAGKTHSMEYTARGRYLVTSGADQVICWPFFGGGPWGKQPLTLSGPDGGLAGGNLVSRVAAHPKDEMVAAGYENGMIILAPLDGRMEMMIHPPQPSSAKEKAGVTALLWNKAGDCLFAGLENGAFLLFTIDSVRKAVMHV
ncbi:MAG: WD40 repeat domain-containing protein [Alphaproteobacteria bacterium]|nr:WD40 repeat domain-containing protein [Alphaproteobacteria bacterium]MBV8548488.1 WD40 repeat domain-containing protein [Alphaproteobacteria bacterium]